MPRATFDSEVAFVKLRANVIAHVTLSRLRAPGDTKLLTERVPRSRALRVVNELNINNDAALGTFVAVGVDDETDDAYDIGYKLGVPSVIAETRSRIRVRAIDMAETVATLALSVVDFDALCADSDGEEGETLSSSSTSRSSDDDDDTDDDDDDFVVDDDRTISMSNSSNNNNTASDGNGTSSDDGSSSSSSTSDDDDNSSSSTSTSTQGVKRSRRNVIDLTSDEDDAEHDAEHDEADDADGAAASASGASSPPWLMSKRARLRSGARTQYDDDDGQ